MDPITIGLLISALSGAAGIGLGAAKNSQQEEYNAKMLAAAEAEKKAMLKKAQQEAILRAMGATSPNYMPRAQDPIAMPDQDGLNAGQGVAGVAGQFGAGLAANPEQYANALKDLSSIFVR